MLGRPGQAQYVADMRRATLLAYLVVLGLGGCEQLGQHQETALQGLRVFCALYRAQLFPLSPSQAQAAELVCRVFGQS